MELDLFWSVAEMQTWRCARVQMQLRAVRGSCTGAPHPVIIAEEFYTACKTPAALWWL
jgi:hypothetical protein